MGKIKERTPLDIERGRRLKTAREAIPGMSQVKLADVLTHKGFEYSASAVGMWEQGRRQPGNVHVWEAIAEALDTYASVLLGWPEAPIDKRSGRIQEVYNVTDERGRDAIWRFAQSQPVVRGRVEAEEAKAG